MKSLNNVAPEKSAAHVGLPEESDVESRRSALPAGRFSSEKDRSASGGSPEDTSRWLRAAIWLSILTIGYNILEGLVSIFFGARDETLALLGFGIDSFVEVLSAIGILHMTIRMRKEGVQSSGRQEFERRALRITGISFYILVCGLIASAVVQIYTSREPESGLAGIIITSISILGMGFLIRSKESVGRKLNSPALLADARCSRSCLYLSVAVLLSAAAFQFTGFLYADTAGALAVAYFAFREGRESLKKAASDELSCGCDDHCSA
ncbi:MAG: cation transporter [Leptospiraceae bacterium]|nr:cation transporter [Leptospiraceae bacterium]